MSFFYSFRFFLTVVFSFSTLPFLHATNYYVSNSGNDLNDGTSQTTPWQTIDKVNSIMASVIPGDQILFNRGDRFFGSVFVVNPGTAGNEIIFGSYGTGDLPVITGKKIITGWTVHSGNIYKADLSIGDTVSNLYCNDNIMTIARYPNSDFLRTDNASGNTGFYDAELTQSSGYWNGADCKVRTKNWTYEVRTVANYSGGVVLFSSPTVYSNFSDYGYYFDNKFDLLDTENEFYFDKATSTLYFYAPGGVNPNTLNIEAVVLKNGISVANQKHFIKIQDLNFNGYSGSGISALNNNNNLTVQNSEFRNISLYGIQVNGANGLIFNNVFEDNLNSAISGVMKNSLIKNNNINRTGMIAGYGRSGSGYTAIHANNINNSIIEYNTIDSSGYNGIGIAKANIVRNNVIDYSCLVLNDGGGIDITNCDTLQILNNIISNTIGNYYSSGLSGSYSCGIYVNGALMKNTTIQGNTVSNCRYMGILIDHRNTPENNKVIGNLCYNNFSAQMLFTDYSAATYIPSYNTVVKGNILYSLSADQTCLHLRGHTTSGISDYGTFDSNYYCNPYSEFLVRRTRFLPVFISTVHTLDYRQTTHNKDLNSKKLQFQLQQFGITDTLSGNLLINSTFDSTTYPWISWPSGASIEHDIQMFGSGGLKLDWNGIGYSIGLALSNKYAITTGNYYLVNVSSKGHHNGTFSLWGFSSLSSTTFSFPQTFFSYDTVRNDYSFVYQADITDPEANMSVGLSLPDTSVFVDDLSMYHVNVERIDSTEKSKIFVNSNSTPTVYSLNGITYKDLDGNPVTGSILLQPYSSSILVNEDFIPSRKLNLKVLIEGLYNSVSGLMVSDTAIVLLREAFAPYSIVDSIVSVLDSNGNGSFDSFNAFNSTNYYIVVKHRNGLETWSSSPVYFSGNILNYDFTTAANKAYGNKQRLVGEKYCIYSGEVVKDGAIELADLLQVSNKAIKFALGYIDEDLNGDEVTDLSDIGLVFNNTIKFVTLGRP